jgi:flagellar biogenesis protein FliO
VTAIAARAAVAVLVLAAAVILVRRRARGAEPRPLVAILSRAALGPGTGVAIVEAGGRRLLVGFGRDGVRLVRDLGMEVGP